MVVRLASPGGAGFGGWIGPDGAVDVGCGETEGDCVAISGEDEGPGDAGGAPASWPAAPPREQAAAKNGVSSAARAHVVRIGLISAVSSGRSAREAPATRARHRAR
jgi:hypothetical protein